MEGSLTDETQQNTLRVVVLDGVVKTPYHIVSTRGLSPAKHDAHPVTEKAQKLNTRNRAEKSVTKWRKLLDHNNKSKTGSKLNHRL